MQQIANGIAITHNVPIKLKFNTEFIETINAEIPTHAAIKVAQSSGLSTVPDRSAMSFSEDFAHFCAAVPGCFLLLGNGESGPSGQPLHASDYDFNDALLSIGAEYWFNLVLNRLPIQQ